jgi:hypothetical protein
MLSKVVPGPMLSRRLQQPTVPLITRSLLVLTVIVAVAPMFVVTVGAQTPYLPMGTLITSGTAYSCPAGNGWDTADHMTCQDATVSCPNVSPDLGLTFGYEVDTTKTYREQL